MKKLILSLIVLTLVVPSLAFGIEEFKRTGKIEKDEHGGYSETQRDHHSRRKKQIDDKTGAGYHNGSYHSTGDKCTDKEWQVIDCPGASSSSKSAKKSKGEKAKTNK